MEETVVYFNTDSGLGIGIEGVTIQGGLEEVTNIDGVTIQAIGTVRQAESSGFVTDNSSPRTVCRRGGSGPVSSTNRRGNNSDITVWWCPGWPLSRTVSKGETETFPRGGCW